MLQWDEVPEAQGAQSEGILYNAGYGAPGYPSIGAIPPVMDRELMWRERDAAERRGQLRKQVEEAVLAATASALRASQIADQALSDAVATARKAVP
jgi:hypothetical protein